MDISNINTIYFYITTHCNLNCKHCYLGDNCLSQKLFIEFDNFQKELIKFKENLKKIIILGGEPTIHPQYSQMIEYVATYDSIELIADTNACGMYPVPENIKLPPNYKIRISFEACTPQMNDYIRGKGVFNKALKTLNKLIIENHPVEITITINNLNKEIIDKMIDFFYNKGVREFNFHYNSFTGNSKFNKELMLNIDDLIIVQDKLSQLSQNPLIKLRFPKIITKSEFYEEEINKGFECRKAKKEIILILPDGSYYFCPLDINHKIKNSNQNLCRLNDCMKFTSLSNYYKPLCISWKAHQ